MPRYALLQINSTVGALEQNAARILSAVSDALPHRPDLMIFPELTLAGYPPEDLLLKPGFFKACEDVFAELLPQMKGRSLVGLPLRDKTGHRYNGATLVEDGRVLATYYKNLLPNYSVFDEERYFAHGQDGLNLRMGSHNIGVVICEDAWELHGPARCECEHGANVIACLSASPFHRGKHQVREETFSRTILHPGGAWFLYCNLVGGQDELVFDGGSLVIRPDGTVMARAKEFAEDMLVVDLPELAPADTARVAPSPTGTTRAVHAVQLSCPTDAKPALPACGEEKLSPDAEVYEALVLGLGDYVRKNGFKGVIIGLSGGIDSALTAAIAVDALGKENVFGVTMPSRYSSDDTRSDAKILADNLGIRFAELPIATPYEAFTSMLVPFFEGATGDKENLTDQNLQARIRAVYLMALSNKHGLLVINTSNKSESATGYGTLYGDMVGAYAAIKDVLKLQVWELSRHVNRKHGREVIPVSTIERVPSAELRPGQEDRQSLPDYPQLDPVLELYVEQDLCLDEIVAKGHDRALVQRIIQLVDRSEFKRRQAVLGTRVTPKAFGKDRRLPITNRFRPRA